MMTGSLNLTEVKKDKEFGIAEDSFIPVQKVNSEELIEKFKEEGVKEDE